MPRQPRLDAPGVLHHVMIRGIERRKIFLTDQDREDFLRRLADLLPRTGTACYAWAFMPNHARFLFRSGSAALSAVMRRLLTGYAVGFNRRHRRTGRLFQNRYKSIVCQEDAYLLELVRYVHLNPVRAGTVGGIRELSEYPYGGHSVLMGAVDRPWQDVPYVLRTFGRTAGRAREAYLRYVEEGLGQGRREDLAGGGLIRSAGGWAELKRMKDRGGGYGSSDERILGDPAFVEGLLAEANEAYERRYGLKRRGVDAAGVARRVGEIFGMDPQDVLSRGKQRQKVKARSLYCFWTVRELGMTLRDLAGRLGMSPPAVGYSVERGERIARENGYRLLDEGNA